MGTIIEVENLRKSFGAVKAVDDISFSVEEGMLFAFLGLNGAGKSTTINILCGTLKKDAGAVRIDGIDVEKDPESVKKRIGVVFQGSVLDDRLSVSDNLSARVGLYGQSKEEMKSKLDTAVKLFELESLLRRPYGKLSGGQRRRTDVARAFLNDPKVLFLDEPTTGLDPATRLKVWDILETLKHEKGLTIFLTTHYMEETARADRVVILDQGKIMAEGTPDELKNKYASDTVRIIAPRTAETDEILQNQNCTFTYANGAYRVGIRGAADAIEFLNRNKALCADFEVLKGNMDDVFLAVTGKDFAQHNLEGRK